MKRLIDLIHRQAQWVSWCCLCLTIYANTRIALGYEPTRLPYLANAETILVAIAVSILLGPILYRLADMYDERRNKIN